MDASASPTASLRRKSLRFIAVSSDVQGGIGALSRLDRARTIGILPGSEQWG
jgi:hypothetical protein